MSHDDTSTRSAGHRGAGRDDQDELLPYEREDEREDKRTRHRRGFLRRHPVLLSFLVLLGALVTGGLMFAFYLNAQLGNIERLDLGALPDQRRPATVNGESVNILLAGVDKGDGRSIAEIQASGWDPGVLRTDTIMVLHVTTDRQRAYVISIPRDSYVRLYGADGRPEEMNKINAAFSLYGPAACVATVEQLTQLRMDHLAVVDWDGFEDITNALGGVAVTIPGKGTEQLDGEESLKYVRTRYGLPGGDFDRIDRQQNFLRAMTAKLLSKGTLTNPFTLTSTLKAVVGNLTVDEEFDNGEIRGLALSLRGLQTSDITFLTAPFGSFGTTEAGASIVRLDERQSEVLWKAAAQDQMAGYLERYGSQSEVLPNPGDVN